MKRLHVPFPVVLAYHRRTVPPHGVLVDLGRRAIYHDGRVLVNHHAGRQAFRLACLLLIAYPSPLLIADAIDDFWGEREDGGPLKAREILGLCLTSLRPWFEACGFQLSRNMRGAMQVFYNGCDVQVAA